MKQEYTIETSLFRLLIPALPVRSHLVGSLAYGDCGVSATVLRLLKEALGGRSACAGVLLDVSKQDRLTRVHADAGSRVFWRGKLGQH